MRGVFAGLAMSHTSHDAGARGPRRVRLRPARHHRPLRRAGPRPRRDPRRRRGRGERHLDADQGRRDRTTGSTVLAPEATALGAAMLAAVAAGIFRDLDDAVGRTVELAPEPFVPDRQRQSLYAESYARYRCALPRASRGRSRERAWMTCSSTTCDELRELVRRSTDASTSRPIGLHEIVRGRGARSIAVARAGTKSASIRPPRSACCRTPTPKSYLGRRRPRRRSARSA